MITSKRSVVLDIVFVQNRTKQFLRLFFPDQKYFPWRIFWQFFSAQLLTYNALFVIVISYLYYQSVINLEKVYSGNDLSGVVYQGFFIYLIGTVIFAFLTSYRYCTPLQRMLIKALRLSGKRSARLVEDYSEDIFTDGAADYSELETALNRIGRRFKKKKDQLIREREENQVFMASVPEGLVSLSPAGQLLYFNSQFASLFIEQNQMQSAAMSGFALNLSDVIRVPEVLKMHQAAVETGENQKVDVKIITRLDGKTRYFSVSMTPLLIPKTKEVMSTIGIFHDITEMKVAEQIRIEFVGNASHELRTPLTSIKGYVETLKEDYASYDSEKILPPVQVEQTKKFLAIISRNVDRLIDLVNDLLNISSLESNPGLEFEDVHALQVSEQIINELAVLAQEKNILIRVCGDVPPFSADLRSVEQVLRNLISNAIKYVPRGSEVKVTWMMTDIEVHLHVMDNGPGIAEEHLPRLFERFYRIDRGRSRDQGGTGLGLAIVKHIMQGHGGSITVKSELGKGAEFICHFPLERKKDRHSDTRS